VLQSCLSTVSNVARERGSTLLSAKLLVISRLLHKHLQAQSDQPLLKTLATRLSNLRQKLLQRIDKRFARAARDNASLIEDMTAFALATSSTPTDVLKHFHFIRLNAVNRPESSQGAEESIVRRITLFVQTLRDVKACFPDLFASSLKLLGTKPLLEDTRIVALDELRLDLHAHWLPGSVRNYTPYTRHDELSNTKANDVGKSWGKEAYVSMGTAVEIDIKSVTDIESIIHIRKSALQLWLASGRQARGLPWHEILTNLRSPFIQQAQALIQSNATMFGNSLTDTITSALESWSASSKGFPEHGLWTQSLLHSNLSNGALDFRNDLITRRTGRDETIVRLVRILRQGREKTQRVQDILKEMSETRWDYDEDDDDDESVSPIDELSKADPQVLQRVFSQSTSAAIASIEKSLTIQLQDPHLKFSDANQAGPFILRVIRELRHGLPQISMIISKSNITKPSTHIADPLLCANLVADLHSALGTSLVQRNVSLFASSLSSMLESRYDVESLWAGTPALPLQLSTGTFKYLRMMVKDMEAMGTDLWSSDALVCFRSLQQRALELNFVDQLHFLEEREKRFEDFVQSEKRQQQDQGVNGHAEQKTTRSNESAATGASANDMAHNKDEDVSVSGSQDASQNILTTLGIPNGTPATPINEATEAHGQSTEPKAAETDSSTTAETSNTSETPPTETAPELTTEATTESPTTPPSPPAPPPRLPTQLTSKLIQLYFDVLYLDAAFPLSTTGSPLQSIAQKLKHKAQLDSATEARVVKSASEYWRKTYLLFGLLVGQ